MTILEKIKENALKTLRIRLDEIPDDSRTMLLSLDFSKPPSAEHREIFGADCDLFDLFFEAERFFDFAVLQKYSFAHSYRTASVDRIPGFDPMNSFPLYRVSCENDTLYEVSDPITDQFRMVRYNNDQTAYAAALHRIGLAVPCDCPKSDDTFRERCNFPVLLPKFYSMYELMREIRKIKLVFYLKGNHEISDWNSFCALSELKRSRYIPERLEWFDYEGLKHAFDADFLLRGAAFGIAEILVNEHGFEWDLSHGIPYIRHAALPEAIAVKDIIADYGFSSPSEDTAPGNDPPELGYLCVQTIKAIVRKIFIG